MPKVLVIGEGQRNAALDVIRACSAAGLEVAERELPENVAFAHIDVAALMGDAKEPPKEFRIFPAGIYATTKGEFLFDDIARQRVMAKVAEWGNDYCVDYDHMMLAFLDANSKENKEAAAWYRPDLRDGELWATKVEWIPEAAAKVTSKKYRYISPAWHWEKDPITGARRIVELVNVGLTNLPATLHQKPLVASRGGAAPAPAEEKPMTWKNLLARLGLAETASESDAMAALERLLGPVAQLASLTGKPTPAEALAVVQAWKNDAARAAELAGKLALQEEAAKKTQLANLIDEGKRSGKLTEPMLAWANTQTPEALKAYLDVAQPVVPTNPAKQPSGDPAKAATLTSEEIAVAKQMGIDIEELKKTKQKHLEESAA